MRVLLALVAVTGLLVVTGCVQDEPMPTLPPTPTAEPVFESEEEALAAAEEAYAAYLEMSDQIGREGGQSPERLEPLATGSLIADAIEGFEEFRAAGRTFVGETVILSSELQYVNLSAASGTAEVLAAYFCLDVSNVDVIDANGVSVVDPGRPPIQAVEVTFAIENDVLLPSDVVAWDVEQVCAL